MRRADRAFSYYIRQRDADDGGTCECPTCGRLAWWKDFDCGHFVSRRFMGTRYEEQNASAQCRRCNKWGSGEQYKHGKYLDEKWGPGTADALVILSQVVCKTSVGFFLEQEEKFLDRLRVAGWEQP
jgi:hypothetical protein